MFVLNLNNEITIGSAKNWKAVSKLLTETIQLIVFYYVLYVWPIYIEYIFRVEPVGWTKLCKCLWSKISSTMTINDEYNDDYLCRDFLLASLFALGYRSRYIFMEFTDHKALSMELAFQLY